MSSDFPLAKTLITGDKHKILPQIKTWAKHFVCGYKPDPGFPHVKVKPRKASGGLYVNAFQCLICCYKWTCERCDSFLFLASDGILWIQLKSSIHLSTLYLFISTWGQESNRWLVCNMVHIWVIHAFREKGRQPTLDTLMYMFLDNLWILGEKIWSNTMRVWEIFGATVLHPYFLWLCAFCLFPEMVNKINTNLRKSLFMFVCLLLPDENYLKILYFKSCIH